MSNHIWVWVETERDEIKKISLEMLSKARELANGADLSVSGIVVDQGLATLSETLFRYGADRVYLVRGGEISPYDTDACVNMIYTLVKESGPGLLLLGATSLGREMAPRLAAKLNAGLISDCVAVKLEKGQLVGNRPIYNGKAHAMVVCQASSFCIATARAGIFDIHESRLRQQVENISFSYQRSEKSKVEFLAYIKGDPQKINLKEAEIIIAFGRGLENVEHIRLIEELADLLGASIGGTRAAVDMKWLPLERQIGITGITVSPRLFISCGISGQYPHAVGMDASDNIIVINNERDAPMFRLASLGVIGSLEKIIPALSRIIKSLKENEERT
ncbi:MAG TPA: electron transfer flavoprotein subunit alpha/FixB family protein [Dehalococcoidales bacterium]|nr:electron transfer flavoprotein subunit alpha/FixB family protein [Dehalococcoidales bacterium]